MKKVIIYGFMLSSLLMGATSCESALDINQDPNYPVNASEESLFPSAVAASAARLGGDLQLIGSIWSQHYTQNNTSNQYKNIDSYSLNRNDYNGLWSTFWSGALKDLSLTKQKAQASGKVNYYMAASILAAFDYHVLSDFYGAIPYKEGLQAGTIPQPKWDDSKEVNKYLIIQLDEAIAKAADAKKVASMGKIDYLFNGDIDQWVKFAKTLKLKIFMRDFNVNSAAITALLQEGDLLTIDAKMDVFADSPNKSNPLYENDRRQLNTGNNLKASNTLLAYLKENNDPRATAFYNLTDPSEGDNYPGGELAGLDQGDFLTEEVKGYATSIVKLAATDAVYFISAAESAFLQAEAWVRLNDDVKAKAAYDNAVKLAFARWAHDGSSFVAAGGKYEFKPGTQDQKLELILTQKWIAATRCQAWDSFFDQGRTGIPKLSPVHFDATGANGYVKGQWTVSVNSSLVAGEIPRRLAFPKSSSDFNPNTPTVLPINQKMWWHK
ncbi:SusD/RagB family nutrient-binding outer membrane lipoprotein [Solitalea lacus]|uniref:SusD/RagB family nutrient-binding outer membrane lipoprotein n=1 Tax=Solitalea lacus TaxID=2911172 RepID=UPI001EDB9950|nr:SusD/RagB family nutrient-binding outer membrane lipoprotein [Solitalea lacus]UKJ07694.1 SusD/RagB family nutrient-binding outer membrane lipoprotein [Solitalea lacus]